MSKVLLINGSPNQFGCTYTALHEAETALNACGVETEIFWIGKKAINGCTACGACAKLGKCVFDDDVNAIAARLNEFDGFIFGSPVYYSAPSGQICAFLDRLFYSASASMAYKPGAAVVSCRRGGATAAFDRLNKYFTINNMPVVSANYWNQIHGNTPEEAMQDIEGLQTMRILGKNMAWLIKCIEAAKASSVEIPEREARMATNFIR